MALIRIIVVIMGIKLCDLTPQNHVQIEILLKKDVCGLENEIYFVLLISLFY